MLQMTSEAAVTLSQARAKEGLPEHFGVRIFAAPDPSSNSSSHTAFGFGFVESPQAGDVIGEAEGTPYYVAPDVAPVLDDVVLDVADTGNLVLTKSTI
jgi:Fe-S cluster assembly iron-binding protein IscA